MKRVDLARPEFERLIQEALHPVIESDGKHDFLVLRGVEYRTPVGAR